MKKLITEFIGTYFLILTIGTVVLGGAAGHMAPVAIGAALMVMIFAGGHISGAHYNPAVTLAVLIRGRIKLSEALQYMVVQCAGAALAAFTVKFLLADKVPPIAIEMADTSRGILAELLGTFALAYVVLNVATAKGTSGNSFYGLAIGFTVTAMAFALGGISGGAFNPAVAVGISIMNMAAFSQTWVFFGAGFAGAALAAIAFKMINPDDK